MGKDAYLHFLVSALIQVNSDILSPAKVLMWMDATPTPEGLYHTAATIKFWLDAADTGKMTSRQLRHNLGYWLMGHMNYTDAIGLEFVSTYFRSITDGSRRDSQHPSQD